jgi:molybdate transport system substrate-binding protein
LAGDIFSLTVKRATKMRRLILFFVPFVAFLHAAAAQTPPLTLFAAASLTDAMKAIDQAWVAKGHPAIRMSFAASSTLARQLEHGAPANIFASADEAWMDWAVERHLIDAASRRNVVSTQLVLVVPKDRSKQIDIKQGFDLAGLLGRTGRLAVGDPAHVPAGRYAKQALTNLGVWDSVSRRLAPTDSVRTALLLIERGEVPAGIVYSTDAAASTRVADAGVFPSDSHDPITYPFAITRTGDTPEARALLDFISGPDGRAIFARFGFATQ